MPCYVVIREYIFRLYDELWMRAPGLGLILSAGTYTWLTLLLMGYLMVKKQWKKILIFAIPVYSYVRLSIDRCTATYV